jgi:hypothetical protein
MAGRARGGHFEWTGVPRPEVSVSVPSRVSQRVTDWEVAGEPAVEGGARRGRVRAAIVLVVLLVLIALVVVW